MKVPVSCSNKAFIVLSVNVPTLRLVNHPGPLRRKTVSTGWLCVYSRSFGQRVFSIPLRSRNCSL